VTGPRDTTKKNYFTLLNTVVGFVFSSWKWNSQSSQLHIIYWTNEVRTNFS